jgi:phage-related protein
VELLAKLLGPVLQLIGWILSNIVGPALLLVINIIAGAITVIATVIGWFTNFGSTLQSVANFVGFLVGKLGDLLGILGKVKDAAGSALGGVLSHIPGFAEGTDDAPGGLAWVGEHGPELMMVPQHATIYPSGTGPASNSSTSSGESGRGVHIGALHVYGDDADQTARAVAAQLNWQQMLLG